MGVSLQRGELQPDEKPHALGLSYNATRLH